MIETHGQRYDGRWSAWQWAMLRTTRPELAPQAASSVLAEEADRLAEHLSLALYGDNTQQALAAIWEAQINGDSAGAKAIIDRILSKNIPLPPITP